MAQEKAGQFLYDIPGSVVAIRPYDEREALRKTLLKRMGLSQGELGVLWGRSQSFVSQFLSGYIRSPHHEDLFSQLVDRPAVELFDAQPKVIRSKTLS